MPREKKKKNTRPWISAEERRHMEIILADARALADRTEDPTRKQELGRQIKTLCRELAFDLGE